MPTFGTLTDPGHFVEIPDAGYVSTDGSTNTKRPQAGAATLLVVDAVSLTPLDPITVGAYGRWSYTSPDGVHWIKVSGDGVNWVGPLQSVESKVAAGEAGATAALALTSSTAALDKATEALAVAGTAGGGSSVEEIYETGPGSYPPPTSTIRRVFIGQVRPTLAQGRRDKDLWRNVVYASS